MRIWAVEVKLIKARCPPLAKREVSPRRKLWLRGPNRWYQSFVPFLFAELTSTCWKHFSEVKIRAHYPWICCELHLLSGTVLKSQRRQWITWPEVSCSWRVKEELKIIANHRKCNFMFSLRLAGQDSLRFSQASEKPAPKNSAAHLQSLECGRDGVWLGVVPKLVPWRLPRKVISALVWFAWKRVTFLCWHTPIPWMTSLSA